ncbi:hypothetical protein ACFVU2_03650 [Leifsonia sp. NPDC058194]|uniref:hypothetical protein n=1 Tax=Leifsonia sp. NPDC058194 TaxID=3346374 RepID=UPI0036D7BA2A
MVDYEHQPTPGPVVWIGAGALAAAGGAALLWLGVASGEAATMVLGVTLGAAGVVTAVGGVWRAARTRRRRGGR